MRWAMTTSPCCVLFAPSAFDLAAAFVVLPRRPLSSFARRRSRARTKIVSRSPPGLRWRMRSRTRSSFSFVSREMASSTLDALAAQRPRRPARRSPRRRRRRAWRRRRRCRARRRRRRRLAGGRRRWRWRRALVLRRRRRGRRSSRLRSGRRRSRLRSGSRRRRGGRRRACALAYAEALHEVRVAARDAHRHRARGLTEAAAQRRLHALAGLFDEIEIAARDALEDGARVAAFAAAGRVGADVLQQIVLQVLITRVCGRRLEHRIDLRSLDDRTSSLSFLAAERTHASTAALHEVDVAARELLPERARALALGATPIRARFLGQAEDEAGGGQTRQGDGNESRTEQLLEVQGDLPQTCTSHAPHQRCGRGRSRQWSLHPAQCGTAAAERHPDG